MELDRISNLPDDVIDRILSYLPIRDAVKTSLLSSKWRYKWATLTHLVFDASSFPLYANHLGTSMTNKFVSDIDRVLLLRSGPLQKFELSYPHNLPTDEIDKWILHLSRLSIKKFVLKVSPLSIYKVPSCMFSWQNLTSLELHNCLLRPPSTFKGFKKLKSLALKNVTLDQDVSEILISSSPLLKKLLLTDLNGGDHLKIHAPNLHLFLIYASSYDENYQNRYLGNSVDLIKLMSYITQIGRLHIGGYSLLYLAKGDMPRELPVLCNNLYHLSISINFTNVVEISALLCLLRSVPNLQQLEIVSCWEMIRETSSDLWEADRWNSPFTRLRHIEIDPFGGLKAEIDFINFMLLTTPVLKTMTLKLVKGASHSWDYKGKKGKLEIVKQLLCLKRASTQARIIFMDQ